MENEVKLSELDNLSAHRCRRSQNMRFLIGFNACEWDRDMYGRMKCFEEEM